MYQLIKTIKVCLFIFCLISSYSIHAFCGFFVSGANSNLYNDATQVVMMRKNRRTVMSMSNSYKGPAKDFAMVVPVPVVLKKNQVKTLPFNVFKKIDQLSAPRLVEYWEQDPCRVRYGRGFSSMKSKGGRAKPKRRSKRTRAKKYGVTVEAQFTAGEYQIVILSAKEANGLEAWLLDNQYKLPKGASQALKPYVQQGMKFFVAKVDIKKVKYDEDGVVRLSPLRFDFESKILRLPVRLGLLNAQGKQDLLIYILSPNKRYEVANYKNVFIPTNLEVYNSVRKDFAGFYLRLFEKLLEKYNGRAVITEYAWQTTSCDPCPVPPLTNSDLFTLGGDVLMPGVDINKKRSKRRRVRRRFTGNFSSWILTRLHTRYSKESLSEDLVFKPTYAVTGGRGSAGRNLEKSGRFKKSSTNQFQGRYIIRHYWDGPVNCSRPIYNQWGGPPYSSKSVRASKNLSRAKASTIPLSKTTLSQVPVFGIKGKSKSMRRKLQLKDQKKK